MPQLQVLNPDGTFRSDAVRDLLGVMHFPKSHDRREAFISGFKFSRVAGDFDAHEDNLEVFKLERTDFDILRTARSLKELVGDVSKHYQEIFVAAHWLRFRVYAAMNRPEWNSDAKWQHYLSYLLPLFSRRGHRWTWGAGRNPLRSAVRKFGPSAHFWAAVIWKDTKFADELLRQQKVMPQPNWFSLNPRNTHDILRLAHGYYQAAQRAGIYRGRDGIVPLENIWTLPRSIEAVDLAIDHPDHLLDNGLNCIFAAYRARSSIGRSDHEAELAKKVTTAKAAAKLRVPPTLPDSPKLTVPPLRLHVHRPPPRSTMSEA